MISESWPWKQDLFRWKSLFIKYNTPIQSSKNKDRAYTVIEKSIFYSAFIIRKLIDCIGKLSDEADRYSIHIKAICPIKHVDYMHNMPKEDSYDWEHERSVTARGKDICNWLIHSYVFFVVSDENDIIKFFCVSSDYDRNKVLYKVPISDWLSYIDFIASDDIVQMDCHFNNKKGDYIFTQKKRGE